MKIRDITTELAGGGGGALTCIKLCTTEEEKDLK